MRAVSEPTFFIYRIGCKKTGLFFNCWRKFGSPRTGAYFTEQGVFFRRIETIRKHIGYLTNENGENVHIDNFYIEKYSVLMNTKQVLEAFEIKEVTNDTKER